MIKVTYYRKHNRVTVEGHAYSGEQGHDLVCAAASILTYTLASSVANMAAAGHLKKHDLTLEKGNATLRAKPREQFKGAVTLIFDTVCAGFELLQTQYPDNISYDVWI